MTRKCVTDEEYGCLARRTGELVRRVDEGTLPFQEVMDGLQVLIEGGPASFAESVHIVTVDYSKSLAEMTQAGKYDWVNSDITSDHFPVKGEGQQEKEIVLFHFYKIMTSEDVIAEIEKAGYRPALIEDLLALGASHRQLQKQFPIVAFGSLWWFQGGSRRVPSLHWGAVERGLHLLLFERDWPMYYRFAAVRNAS